MNIYIFMNILSFVVWALVYAVTHSILYSTIALGLMIVLNVIIVNPRKPRDGGKQ